MNEINTIFDIINLKILNDKINLKFSKEDFINAKDKLNQKLEKNKIIFQKLIDSKYQIMENEYDQLIKDFNDGNFESYKASIEETTTKINLIKKDLEEKINEEFKNFTEDIIKELDFIGERLKEIDIKKETKINNINETSNQVEKNLFKVIGLISGRILSLPITIPITLLYFIKEELPKEKMSDPLGMPIGLLICEAGLLELIKNITLFHLGMGGLIGLSIGGLIHGGFFLYEKYT